MGKVKLIRKGVVPMHGAPVCLFGADNTLPKDAGWIIGTGWTQLSNDAFVFDVPPGDNFTSLQMNGLVIGANYRLRLNAVAKGGGYGGMVLRPGDFADDVAIQADGSYDFIFEAQNSNGITRFSPVDVTGVVQIVFSNIKLSPV